MGRPKMFKTDRKVVLAISFSPLVAEALKKIPSGVRSDKVNDMVKQHFFSEKSLLLQERALYLEKVNYIDYRLKCLDDKTELFLRLGQ